MPAVHELCRNGGRVPQREETGRTESQRAQDRRKTGTGAVLPVRTEFAIPRSDRP